jgi:hypothetical protein
MVGGKESICGFEWRKLGYITMNTEKERVNEKADT